LVRGIYEITYGKEGGFSFTGSWDFSTNGISSSNSDSDAASIYLKLSDLPEFNVNNWGRGLYSRTNSQDGYDLCTIRDDGLIIPRQQNVIITRFQNDLYYFGLPLSSSFGTTPNTDSRGFFQTNRFSGSVNAYKNSTLVATQIAPSASAPNTYFTIGNLPAQVLPNASGKQYAFCYIAKSALSNSEASLFYTTVQNFETTLGRQV
jgi:hypothetical protein